MIYDELKGQGLEFVAVALDTAGKPAVEAKVRPDIAEVPGVMQPLRAWPPELWAQMATPTFTCLIDQNHEVAELYGMTNVPTAVWIDEQGKVVRPAEPAGVGDEYRAMDPVTFELAAEKAERQIKRRLQYLDALRDLVRHGADSRHALSPKEVRARLRRPSDDEVRAATHVRLGRHLYEAGHVEAARRHLEAAVELSPDKWNYRRQSMVLEDDAVGNLNVQPGFWEAMEALGEDRYYPPIDMEGIAP